MRANAQKECPCPVPWNVTNTKGAHLVRLWWLENSYHIPHQLPIKLIQQPTQQLEIMITKHYCRDLYLGHPPCQETVCINPQTRQPPTLLWASSCWIMDFVSRLASLATLLQILTHTAAPTPQTTADTIQNLDLGLCIVTKAFTFSLGSTFHLEQGTAVSLLERITDHAQRHINTQWIPIKWPTTLHSRSNK